VSPIIPPKIIIKQPHFFFASSQYKVDSSETGWSIWVRIIYILGVKPPFCSYHECLVLAWWSSSYKLVFSLFIYSILGISELNFYPSKWSCPGERNCRKPKQVIKCCLLCHSLAWRSVCMWCELVWPMEERYKD
jgi:hypothetical protein